MTSPTDPFGLAQLQDPLPISPVEGPLDAVVRVPGSKSVTNRALICAALADGPSRLRGALAADDTLAMAVALRTVGIDVREVDATTFAVQGCGGAVPSTDAELDVRQSGTTARFLLPLLALGSGSYHVTAHPQMQDRPMGATFRALGALGASVSPAARNDALPAVVAVPGRSTTGAAPVIRLAGDESSQFLSGLLLTGPCLPGGLVLELTTDLVSRPYVDLTIAVMEAFGASVDRPDDRTFRVSPSGYRATSYDVEPDASAASYPLAAAAICGGRVTVEGLGSGALQGDAAFADILAAMGCEVARGAGSTTVVGGPLSGGTFDLTHLSDTAQTLAVVAPFASTPTTITGIGFIRRKEIDRIAAVATELVRCGIVTDVEPDGWTIRPGAPAPTAAIQTYEDHRMAMSFALLGLRAPGVLIAGPACVAKTFPGYWQMLEGLRPAADDR